MIKNLFLLSTMATLIFACNTKTIEDNTKEAPKYQHNFKSVENDPLNVLEYELDNGLKVFISVNTEEPRLQTHIAVKTGSINDPSDATGLAHYLEHMLFKGTSKIGTINWEEEKKLLEQISDLYEEHRNTTDPEIRKKIYAQIDSISGVAATFAAANEYDKMISSLGAKGTNAGTSKDWTIYMNDIPSNELEKWLKIESERFSELVLRLFHTELEAVYEEFNRAQDNDSRLARYAMQKAIFKGHPYGDQTTIGTGEHLKNPSMEKIHEYFNTYYVPNNMAIVLAGDINPDKAIELIEKYFGRYERKEIPERKYTIDPLKQETINVTGSDKAWVNIGYRLPGALDEDALKLEMLFKVLYNSSSGLIDINLNKDQKVLKASAYAQILKEHTALHLIATPKEGQTLEEAKNLLLEQIEKLKKGEFEDWLIPAIVKNNKWVDAYRAERNSHRAWDISDAFTKEIPWEKIVARNDKIDKITKQDVIDLANKYLGENYIVVNKLNGTPNPFKVEKPKITQIPLNRDTSSNFMKEFEKMESERVTPVFTDYKKEISSNTLANGLKIDFVTNTVNDVFELQYIFDLGKNHDNILTIAAGYLNFLATDKYSAKQIEEELYKLAVDMNMSVLDNKLHISLSGLEESLEEAVVLFEHVLNNAKPNDEVLKEYIGRIIKSRNDNKLNDNYVLFNALSDYALYGKNNPTLNQLSIEELNALTAQQLVDKIKEILNYKHTIYYFGKTPKEEVISLLNEQHKVNESLKNCPEPIYYQEQNINANKVFFVHHDMVQTKMMMYAQATPYNEDIYAFSKIHNEYFGGGLSSIVFQEIRESKALAYSARATMSNASHLGGSFYSTAFIGTQFNKLNDAANAMIELLNNMPEAEEQFQDAKLAALKQLETSRSKKNSIYWSYLNAKEFNRDYDLNEKIYTQLKAIELKDLKSFFDQNIKGKKYYFLVIGDKNKLDLNVLKKLGEFKELSKTEIFGY